MRILSTFIIMNTLYEGNICVHTRITQWLALFIKLQLLQGRHCLHYTDINEM